MSSTVLYRKWRPGDFSEIVGQDVVVRTLENAIAQDRISHAYLFCGPRGTGKTTTARILARAINGIAPRPGALGGGDDGLGFDLIEIDAASNRGIDDIRDLRERANYQPSAARFKVYLIDEVHQLTDAAADALLKTLEEPPPHVVFILATTDPEQLKSTILSRCQRFDFRRVGVDDIIGRLRTIAGQEGFAIPDEALRLIARESTGSLRDAVNLLEQVWTTVGNEISLEQAQETLGLSPDARALDLAAAALEKDLPRGLSVIGDVQADAVDLQRFKKQVVAHLRHIVLMLTKADAALSLSAPELERLQAASAGTEAPAAVAALRAFASADLRADPWHPLPLELALADLAYAPARARAEPASGGPASAPRRQGGGAQQPRQRQAQQRPPQPDRSSAPARPAAAPPQRDTSVADQPRQAEPAAAAAASGGGPDDLLRSVREQLRGSKNGRLSAMLNGSCRITEQSDDALTLGFLPNFQNFHQPEIEGNIQAVAEAFSRVLGREVSIRCVAIDRAPAAPPPAGPSSAAPSPASPPPSNPATAPAPAEQPPPSPQSAPPPPPPEPSYSLADDAQERFGAKIVRN